MNSRYNYRGFLMEVITNLNNYGLLKDYDLSFETEYGIIKYHLSVNEFESLNFDGSDKNVRRQIEKMREI